MAHLNVRDRRLEAKVVYLGPELSGKWTNLEQLGKRDGADAVIRDGDVASVSYRAPESVHFRDCDVRVNVVARRGALSVEGVQEIMNEGDVDGVVLVLDAQSTAQAKNREAARIVQDAVRSRKIPVVVQMNKQDLADADSVFATGVAEEIGEAWPQIEAAAKTGDGVVETIDRMLEDVLETLRKTSARATNEALAPAAPTGVRVEGNPLLTALRQVLRDTVTEHLAELEARMTAQMDARLQLIVQAAQTAHAAGAERSLQKTVDEMARGLGRVERASAELRAATTTASELAARALTTQGKELTKLAQQIEALTAAAARRDEDALSGQLDVLASRVAEMHKRLLLLCTKEDFSKRLSESVDATREIGDRIVKLGEATRTDERESRETLAQVQTTASELHSQLSMLIDELKKPKKGWFA